MYLDNLLDKMPVSVPLVYPHLVLLKLDLISSCSVTMMTRAANDPSVFTLTQKAPTRALSWLKEPTSDFTFKTLLRLLAKQVPKHGKYTVYMKLGHQHNFPYPTL